MQDTSSPKTIRLLVFSSLFPHEGEPTLGIFVRNRLLHLLADEDIEATVVAPVPWFPFKSKMFGRYGRAAQAKEFEIVDDVEVFHPRYLVIPKIGMMLTPRFMAFCAKRAVKKLLAKGKRFDAIDAHYLFPDGVAACELAKHFKLPYVLTARGSDITQIGQMPGPQKLIVNACYEASHVITVSRSLKDRLVEIGVKADHISSLRNGVDSHRFRPVEGARTALCQETGLDTGRPILLFAGWLIQRKRVDIILDALKYLPEVQALIIGDGELRQELMQHCRSLQLEDRVVFAGQKTPADMPFYFSAADILCLPSEREGWANVMLEAMACGTPVIARAVDGALELITDDAVGRLVQGDEPAAYADAVKSVLKHKIDRASVRRYAEGFSWQATSAAQAAIFRKAINQ